MPLRINHNIAAINSRHRLNANNRDLRIRLERLSSGLRVNRASDDAAGLTVREGMRAEISGLKMNVLNAEQGSNLLQVAEGSLNEINAMLIRMRELAVQSASSTVNEFNRQSIQAEYTQLTNEIERVARSTTYNDQVILTGFGNTVQEVDTLYVDGDDLPDDTDVGDVKDAASTALTASDTTGVIDIKISGAQVGEYTFVDFKHVQTADDGTETPVNDDIADGITANTHGEITLGNGIVTQTIDINTMLDGEKVADGTTVVANFDRLGIQVTLAGADVANATGSYSDSDLNGKTIIINGGTGGSFQVGPDDGVNNRIEVTIRDMTAKGPELTLDAKSVGTLESAREAITHLDQAINKVSNQRGDIGAYINRLAFTIAWTENSIENIQNSEASISDADIAAEVSAFTRAQILSQTATAMLAQSNVVPQTALSLLQ